MRYGIPTRVYNLSSDHLGGLLNLMSDLHDWITKGYIIKINVYLEEKDDCGRETSNHGIYYSLVPMKEVNNES